MIDSTTEIERSKIIPIILVSVGPAYYELTLYCHIALKKLGYKTEILKLEPGGPNFPQDTEDLVIIFGMQGIFHLKFPKNHIIFQLEYWKNDAWFTSQAYIQKLQEAPEIWDYSFTNAKYIVDIFQYNSKNIYYVPIAYLPEMERNDLEEFRKDEIDVIFFGGLYKRRRDIFKKLKKDGFNMQWYHSIWDIDDRDKKLLNGKICLNTHLIEDAILETNRIVPLLAKRKCIISEKCGDKEMMEYFKDIVIFCDKEQMSSVCKIYCNNDKLRKEQEQRGYDFIKKTNYLDSFSDVLTKTKFIDHFNRAKEVA